MWQTLRAPCLRVTSSFPLRATLEMSTIGELLLPTVDVSVSDGKRVLVCRHDTV